MDSVGLKALFPEFATEDDVRVEMFISIATQSVSPAVFLGLTDPATAYLAAHYLAMSKRGSIGASGAVTSSSVGDLARSYASPDASLDAELSGTPYGIQYLWFRRQILITPMVTC